MQSTSGHGPVCLKFSLSSRGNYEGALNERGISQNGKIRYLSNSGTLHQMAKHFSPDTTEQEEALFQGKIMDEYAVSRVGHQFGNYRLIRLLGQGPGRTPLPQNSCRTQSLATTTDEQRLRGFPA